MRWKLTIVNSNKVKCLEKRMMKLRYKMRTKESQDFKIDYLFKYVHVGYEELEVGQIHESIIKEKEIALSWEDGKK